MAAAITDVLIIALLVCSIGYGYLVSRRVQTLMKVLENLEPLVGEFSQAVDKSEASVSEMRRNLEDEVAHADGSTDQGAETAKEAPAFSSWRGGKRKLPGVQVVRNKQDLVRRFFESTHGETTV